jgi:hypothetical protein
VDVDKHIREAMQHEGKGSDGDDGSPHNMGHIPSEDDWEPLPRTAGRDHEEL